MQRLWIVSVLALLLCLPAFCSTIVINFESFADGQTITTQVPGLAFTHTVIAAAGISLSEFDFPPHSGKNVVFDNSAPISIAFSSPVLSFGGYFTYVQRLTLLASGPAVPPIMPVFSKFSNNTGTGGDPGSSPNEFLQASFPGGITSVSITGSLAGGSFAMDDVTLTGAPGVPEPTTAVLTLIGLGTFGTWLRRRSSVGD